MSFENLLYVGFNGRVVALDQQTGEIVWSWKCPKPSSGMVAVLVEHQTVFASIQGYTYALDTLTGEQLWFNPLRGMGVGVPCLATAGTNTMRAFLAQAQHVLAEQQQAANHAST